MHTAKIVCDEETRELEKGEGSSIYGEDRFFIDCVKHDRPIELPAANLDEAIKTMELCEAILAGLRED